MNPDQIEKLRALAEAVTQPSPWEYVEDERGRCAVNDCNDLWVADCGMATAEAKYIAAASPDNIIALLDILKHYQLELLRLDVELAKKRHQAKAFSDAHKAVR